MQRSYLSDDDLWADGVSGYYENTMHMERLGELGQVRHIERREEALPPHRYNADGWSSV